MLRYFGFNSDNRRSVLSETLKEFKLDSEMR
jgi:hypothetical protein